MIRFFQKIRKILVNDNRLGRYIFYAIGEIVLVVIGILIALQVNNRNLQRKYRAEEKVILYNLNNEFRKNKMVITNQIERYKSLQECCITLMSCMNKDAETLDANKVDSLVFTAMEHQAFNPSNAILSELIGGAKLGLINDLELKDKLFEWLRELENNTTSFRLYEKWIEEHVILYLAENIALKNIDKYSSMAWKSPSEHESGIHEIFQERKFENIIDNELYHISTLLDDYKKLEIIIDDIIAQTSS